MGKTNDKKHLLSPKLAAALERVKPALTSRTQRLDQASANIRGLEGHLKEMAVAVSAWVTWTEGLELEESVYFYCRKSIGWDNYKGGGFRLLLKVESAPSSPQDYVDHLESYGAYRAEFSECLVKPLIEAKSDDRLKVGDALEALITAVARASDPYFRPAVEAENEHSEVSS